MRVREKQKQTKKKRGKKKTRGVQFYIQNCFDLEKKTEKKRLERNLTNYWRERNTKKKNIFKNDS